MGELESLRLPTETLNRMAATVFELGNKLLEMRTVIIMKKELKKALEVILPYFFYFFPIFNFIFISSALR